VKITRKLWIGVIVLAALTPLGLLLPAWLGGGTAWGEWSADELRALVGYVPRQMGLLGNLWHAPLPDYSRPGATGGMLGHSLWYIVSALLGVAVVGVLSLLLGRWLARNEHSASSVDD
jgi:cobalt/nickel transport protein